MKTKPIRIPEELHWQLKQEAAASKMTLTAYVLWLIGGKPRKIK